MSPGKKSFSKHCPALDEPDNSCSITLCIGSIVVSLVLLLVTHGIKKWLHLPVLYPFELLCAVAASGSLILLAASVLYRVGTRSVSPWTILLILGFIIAVYCIVIAGMSVARYSSYHRGMYDLGLLDQAIWNTLSGHFFETTHLHPPYNNASSLATHFEIFSGVFAFFYLFWADPRILLVGQTILVGLSIFVCFQVAKRVVDDLRLALFFAFLWALFPALHFANLFDVHGDVLTLPFLFAAYLFYLDRKTLFYWIVVSLSLLCKEYIAFALMGLGLAIAMVHRDRKTGFITIFLGTAYFCVVFYFIMPLLRLPDNPDILGIQYADIGGNAGFKGMVCFLVSHPREILCRIFSIHNGEQFFYLFFPLLILPFLQPWFLIATLPLMTMNVLARMNIGNHRLAAALPFLFIAAMHGLSKIKKVGLFGLDARISTRLLVVFCTAASLLSCFAYGPTPLGHRFWRERTLYTKSDHEKNKDRMVGRVPAEARVSASDNAALHLAHRRFCYMFPRPMAWGNLKMMKPIDYILLDTTEENSCAWDQKAFLTQTIPTIKHLGFALIDSADGIFLFKKRF
jgi:uncharacterized membrane protein